MKHTREDEAIIELIVDRETRRLLCQALEAQELELDQTATSFLLNMQNVPLAILYAVGSG